MNTNNWSIEKIYKNEEERLKDLNLIEEELEKLAGFAPGDIDNIYEIMVAYYDLYRKFSHYYSFARMTRDTNTKDPEAQRLLQETEGLLSRFQSQTAFIRPFLLSIEKEKMDEILKEDRMKRFKLSIERILRYRDHTLSAKEEEILTALSEVGELFESSFFSLSYADIKFPKLENGTEITQANFVPLLENPDREIRKEAFEKYYSVYDDLKNTYASQMYGNVVSNVREARLRGFDGARELALFADDVDLKVYDALVDAVEEFIPILQEYYEVKGKAQGIEELHMYDVYLPLDTGEDMEVPYEEAQKWLLEAVAPLGEDYQKIVEKSYKERWIDVYPRDGKQSGAYSGGSYDSHPYILLNYMDNLDSAFTLAHEMGHSAHSYLSRGNNSFEEASYTIFVAEVASTFNELLLLDYLMNQDISEDRRLQLVNHLLNSFKSTVFRQTMFAEFEDQTHKRVLNNGTLTDGELREMYLKLNKKYFGDAVVSDEEIALEYARIPHFYRAFYVYKYATGFLSSVILSNNVLEGKEGAKEAYIEFLKDGGKNFPLDQLKKAGVDLTDSESLKEGLNLFKSTVKEFKEILENR